MKTDNIEVARFDAALELTRLTIQHSPGQVRPAEVRVEFSANYQLVAALAGVETVKHALTSETALDDAPPTSQPLAANSDLEYWIDAAQKHADEHYQGHLTAMRFTTGWKVMFGTPDLDGGDGRSQIWNLQGYDTLRDALVFAVTGL